MTRPVLSILFTARNDNYHKDFVNRLEYVINYYIHTLNQLNFKNVYFTNGEGEWESN